MCGGGARWWAWVCLGLIAASMLPLVAPGCERGSPVLSSGTGIPLLARMHRDADAGRGRGGEGGGLLRLRGGDDKNDKDKDFNKPWLESSWEEEHMHLHPDHLMMRPDVPDIYGIPRDSQASSPEPEFQTTDERIDYFARKVREVEIRKKKREEEGRGNAGEEEEKEEGEEEGWDTVPSSDDALRADPDDEKAEWYKRCEFPRSRRQLHEYARRTLEEIKAEEREEALNRTEPESYLDISDLVIDSEEYAYYEDEDNFKGIDDIFTKPPGPQREEDEETIARLRSNRWFKDKPWQKKQVAMMEQDVAKRKFTDQTCQSAVGQRNALGQQLIVASRTGDLATMEMLIKEGVNPNFQDYCRDTALHWACISGQWRSVRLLLGAGADPELQTEMGRTALHHAAAGQNLRVLHELLKSGCNTSVEDWSGFTPMDIAHTIKSNSRVETIRPREVESLLKNAGSNRLRESSPSRSDSPFTRLQGDYLEDLVNIYKDNRTLDHLNLGEYISPDGPPPIDLDEDSEQDSEEWASLCKKVEEVERAEIMELGGAEELKDLDRQEMGLSPVVPRPAKAPLSHYKHGSGLTGDAKIERIDVLGKKAVKKQRFSSGLLGV